MIIQKIKYLFPHHRAYPEQASFLRRAMAFGVDVLIIGIISSIAYSGYSEIKAWLHRKPSPTSKIIQEARTGSKLTLDLNKGAYTETNKEDNELKSQYLKILKEKLTPEEYDKALASTEEEILKKYWPEISPNLSEIIKENASKEILKTAAKKEENQAYKIIKEYIITLLYFVLFFRITGQTPGKKLFRLKVIDLSGKPRLDWYQCFERAHGYVCSGLFASLGFWQVLWHKQGLTLHDKIADTTVIQLPKKPKKKKLKRKKSKEKLEEK